MNALNVLPIVGWAIAAIMCFIVAIPIWWLWGILAPIYFAFLPPVYLSIPFWHMVGLVWLITSLKGILLPSFGGYQSNSQS